ncbi:MAG: glycerol-3-phosphate acyltransferase [Chloroflexi bacterium HGW-Chloroflexi-1]|nr:MAG: glycerol-3-phosphate acyltransferase [Chloroflexi bacterium HGW-Chloroflexi-1]
MWLSILLAAVVGYLLGAIPFGYLVGKAWGVDVRRFGSGRTGGTNVWRATGQILPPLLSGFGDMAKGIAAVLIGRLLFGSELAAALAGAAAVAGHNWSVMLGWRGGAGGATAAAALITLSPLAGVIVVPIAAVIVYISHFASLGTLTVGVGGLVALAALAAMAPAGHPWVHVIYGAITAASVILALRPNIKRLREGNERRITLW